MDMKKAIKELYEIENEEGYREATSRMLSIAVGADHASMLRAIADRFGKSLSSFAGEILEDAVKEAFFYLTDEDKKDLSVKADQETSEYLGKRGVTITSIGPNGEQSGTQYWQGIAAAYLKASTDDKQIDIEDQLKGGE